MAMADYDLSDLAAVVKNNGGSGMFSNGEGLLWLLFILILGWGNGNRGYGGGAPDGGALYPWMNQAQGTWQGFTDILQALCSGFAGVTQAITAGFANAETSATNRAMAGMERDFAAQTATMQGFNATQAQIAGIGAEIAREGCATRQAVNDSARDIMANDNANYQRVMDKLCQLELDGVKAQLAQAESEKAALRDELTAARFQASQVAQNGLIQQGFANEVDALYNRLSNCPVPSMPVYGQTPIFTCNNGGCGCGN